MMTFLILTYFYNSQWPDIVYYHSYTTPYMGGKIHVIDNFRCPLLLSLA